MKSDSMARQIKEIHDAFCKREDERDKSTRDIKYSLDSLTVSVLHSQSALNELSTTVINIQGELQEIKAQITPPKEIESIVNRGIETYEFKKTKEKLKEIEGSRIVDISKFQESKKPTTELVNEGKALSQKAVMISTAIVAGGLTAWTLLEKFIL